MPEVAWAVNVTGDGRLVVAGYGDGTIRWHRIADGEEVLALFVHRDGQRWVAWTPQGYYDASANGDTLIGWQVNRGRDQAADFFPAAQFRERFYRPDVIARVLDTPLRWASRAHGNECRRRGRPSRGNFRWFCRCRSLGNSEVFRAPEQMIRHQLQVEQPE